MTELIFKYKLRNQQTYAKIVASDSMNGADVHYWPITMSIVTSRFNSFTMQTPIIFLLNKTLLRHTGRQTFLFDSQYSQDSIKTFIGMVMGTYGPFSIICVLCPCLHP